MPATGRGVWKLPRARLIARLRRSMRPDGRLSAGESSAPSPRRFPKRVDCHPISIGFGIRNDP
jgi:hypothetical protein